MSDAFRCDACGEFYESDYTIYAKLNGRPVNRISVSRSDATNVAKRAHLCPACMTNALDTYFGGADKPEEQEPLPDENPPEQSQE